MLIDDSTLINLDPGGQISRRKDLAMPQSTLSVVSGAGRARAFGLDQVIVAETELSDVDGAAGLLTVRGHSIEELAGKISFEAMLALLWHGELPGREEERALAGALGLARLEAHRRLPELGAALGLADPMDALRASIGSLPAEGESATADSLPAAVDPHVDGDVKVDSDVAAHARASLRVTAAMPVFAGAWLAQRAGRAPLPPDPAASHAEDALRLLGGGRDAARAAALETYLCTVADHGLNASTFTARVVASTDSDTISAVVAALGALKGKLHGGAPGPVLDLLDAVGSVGRARSVLEAELAAGRRIMGMGHRVYRTRDPRAAVLERATLELDAVLHGERLALARAVEREAEALLATRHPERPLKANVEFFTAVLLEAIGLPRRLFTAVFAIGRVAGWCAHIEEQRRTGRIIRPSSRYVGPAISTTGREQERSR
jgi:citrate synthase